ncbi:hypothetical protein M0R04_10935 [Candidatus Dojkabacteria bacterium]|jgi:hypothetical protein|nr:hypothetical protein [Candidatus Dojkabacteria bacterium]
MSKNIVGAIPEFTDGGQEEVKEPIKVETETPSSPPAEIKPVEEVQEPERKFEQVSEDALKDEKDDGVVEVPEERYVPKEQFDKATQGLRDEIVYLKGKLREVTGTEKRTIEKQIEVKEEQVNELEDLNPTDIEIVEKILKSKGYITQAESKKMSYESTKNDILNTWLENHPEYKPENDVDDSKWNALQREVSLYKQPEDPRDIKDRLDRAHREISKFKGDPTLSVKKQQLKIAGVGAGGVQRSSSRPSKLTEAQKAIYRQGGWSEEEISQMDK